MNKEHLLEYLYGEMSGQERIDFERTLENDKALQKELADLLMVRSFLDTSSDEEATPIKLVINSSSGIKRFAKYWSVAAAILVLLIAGKLLDLNVRIADRQMTISFGAPQEQREVENLPMQQYAELKQDLSSLEAHLVAFQSEKQKTDENRNQIVNAPSQQDQKQLMNFIENALQKQQGGLETRLSNRILEEQQIYIQSVAQDLIRYWDDQRKNDLEIINEGLQNLAQSIQFSNDDLVQLVNNPRNNY